MICTLCSAIPACSRSAPPHPVLVAQLEDALQSSGAQRAQRLALRLIQRGHGVHHCRAGRGRDMASADVGPTPQHHWQCGTVRLPRRGLHRHEAGCPWQGVYRQQRRRTAGPAASRHCPSTLHARAGEFWPCLMNLRSRRGTAERRRWQGMHDCGGPGQGAGRGAPDFSA